MSGAGSAQLEMIPEPTQLSAGLPASALRQEVAERLAAHRRRRGARSSAEAEAATPGKRPARRAGVAAAVAERYAHSPTYRAMLADNARLAIERAEAEAAVAAHTAEAVAAVQTELLAELELWTAPQEFTASPAACPPAEAYAPQPHAAAPIRELLTGGLTVKLYEDLPSAPIEASRLRRNDYADTTPTRGKKGSVPAGRPPRETDEEAALEDEIAFRQAPVFDSFHESGPVEPIAANLLEFPRQLVAPKKARPRHAEGPLREDGPEDWEPRGSQLRIFEVGAQIATADPEPVSSTPEWSSIWLDAQTNTLSEHADDDTVLLPSLLPPATAAVHLRVMAATVDFLLVGVAVVGFAALAVRCANAVPSGSGAALAVAGVFALLYLLYHVLFFSFSGQTPGMRYARIGLCTFTDENPSRAAMRRRVLAMVVAASPLGLGLLWVWLDDDRLGWHDRMSRMYQRAY